MSSEHTTSASCFQTFNELYEPVTMCGPAPFGPSLNFAASITFLAILVLAGMGMAGNISPTVMGWSLTGVSGALTAMAIAGVVNSVKGNRDKGNAAMSAAVAVVIAILSTLTACGIISATTLGWCIYGPLIGLVGLAIPMVVFAILMGKKEENQQQQQSQ